MTELPATATMAAFAKLHGISRSGVYKWRARGLIVYSADGSVDIAESNKRLAERPDRFRGARARGLHRGEAGPLSATFALTDGLEPWTAAEAARRERIAVAKLRELELAREAGKVASIEEVAAKVGRKFSLVRTALLGLAAKLAPRLAVAATPEACRALVDGEVRAALEELSA
jgi:hypothetical protein